MFYYMRAEHDKVAATLSLDGEVEELLSALIFMQIYLIKSLKLLLCRNRFFYQEGRMKSRRLRLLTQTPYDSITIYPHPHIAIE